MLTMLQQIHKNAIDNIDFNIMCALCNLKTKQKTNI